MNQVEWEKIEKEFVDNLKSYFDEINDTIKYLQNNKDGHPFVRAQISLAFIGADTFSRFDRIFEGERKNLDAENEKRFRGWLYKYVFTNENETYKKYKAKIKCDSALVWRMRNSFLHFYSFPGKDKEGKRIIFNFKTPNDLDEKIKKGMKERGEKIILIDAYFLIGVILNGFLIQALKMKDMIKNEPKKYLDAVMFAHPIIIESNARTIMINKNEK